MKEFKFKGVTAILVSTTSFRKRPFYTKKGESSISIRPRLYCNLGKIGIVQFTIRNCHKGCFQGKMYCQIEFVFRVKHQGKIENVKVDVMDCCLWKIGIGKFVIRDGHLVDKDVLDMQHLSVKKVVRIDVVNSQPWQC